MNSSAARALSTTRTFTRATLSCTSRRAAPSEGVRGGSGKRAPGRQQQWRGGGGGRDSADLKLGGCRLIDRLVDGGFILELHQVRIACGVRLSRRGDGAGRAGSGVRLAAAGSGGRLAGVTLSGVDRPGCR